MKDDSEPVNAAEIKKPPIGLAVFMLVGPSMVWAAEYIGSGEVILATRTGAILGPTVLWVLVLGVFLKFWIGMSGGRYTVCTGEGMVDMFSRMPGAEKLGGLDCVSGTVCGRSFFDRCCCHGGGSVCKQPDSYRCRIGGLDCHICCGWHCLVGNIRYPENGYERSRADYRNRRDICRRLCLSGAE